MGKTTLLFHLLEKFRTTARTAFLFQTQCTSREFMRFLLAELGYETGDQDFVRMHEEFNRHLLQEARAGHRFIVVVDEAQNLDASVLETIRLLSDFETPRAKLLQIVLAGQPELADKLASRHMAQLRQRVSLLNGLQALSAEETANYIQHRLRVAGYEGENLFTPQAMATITSFTEGVPRNINNFCFNALSLAFALRQTSVDGAIVQEVIADLDITPHLSQNWLNEPLGPLTMNVEEEHTHEPSNGRRMDAHRHRVSRNVETMPGISQRRPGNGGTLTPTEARAYLEQVAKSLKNWQ
jgi:type II secretory pathway predicted ATPase ExeA